MRVKPILISVAALLAVIGVALVAYRWEASRQAALCQVCSRLIPQQTSYRMETPHGTIHACCPRCAMHDMIDHPGTVRRAWATDFDSRRVIPAETAYYDEGAMRSTARSATNLWSASPKESAYAFTTAACLL